MEMTPQHFHRYTSTLCWNTNNVVKIKFALVLPARLPCMSMFVNNALLGGGVRVRVWIREQRKIKRRSKALLSLWRQTWTSLSAASALYSNTNQLLECVLNKLVDYLHSSCLSLEWTTKCLSYFWPLWRLHGMYEKVALDWPACAA